MSERDKQLLSIAVAFAIALLAMIGMTHLAMRQPVTPADTQEQADCR